MPVSGNDKRLLLYGLLHFLSVHSQFMEKGGISPAVLLAERTDYVVVSFCYLAWLIVVLAVDFVIKCIYYCKLKVIFYSFYIAHIISFHGRRGGLVVCALDSGSRGPGLSPGRAIVLCSWARHFTLTVPL